MKNEQAHDLEQLTCRCRRMAAPPKFAEASLPAHYPPDLELEPVHLDLDASFDLVAKSVEGAVTHTVVAQRNGPTTLTLDAVDFAHLLVSDADGRDLRWSYDGRKIVIAWSQPFAARESRRVTVNFQVVQPSAGLYFRAPDDAYPELPWYAASDHETERARHWLPCLDLPNARTTLDLHLRAESRFTILANGDLVETIEHGDGSKTAHWRLDQRCPSYLLCVAIGDFVAAEDGAFQQGDQQIPFAYFCSRAHSADDLLRTFGRSHAMMKWMVKRLGVPFPYPKYFQFALPGITGAMENITLVSWGDTAVQDATFALEYGWRIDQINVHEMAHSYFGDTVVCRDFAHAWLKESWATYIEQCWREESDGTDEGLYVYYMHAKEYLGEADGEYKRPIVTRRFQSSMDLYDAHLYPGGACRLHTLRCELGDETFWRGVQDYLTRFDGKVVETDDFRHVLEEHSGRSLGKFFDQWFYTSAYPDLKVSFEYDERRKQGLFTIEQRQVDKEKEIPAFELATELGWTSDGQEHRIPIRLDQPRHVFAIAMEARPHQVRFDPGCRVLHKLDFNPGDDLLRTQLTAAPDVIGRILAARELVNAGQRATIQAVIDAYPKEPYWGVRREMAEALGGAKHETALAGLAHLLAWEQAPMVVSTLIRAVGSYRDTRVRDAIQRRLEGGLPYIATQAAYETLGTQRDHAPWETLRAAVEIPSFNGVAQSGALRGLAATRRPEAIDILLQKSRYGAVSNRARPAAVSALADIGKGQEKVVRERIVEQLIDLLRDPWHAVAWAAAHGLVTMRAPEAIPAMEAFGRALSHQEQAMTERLVADLRSQDKSDGSAVRKQVEELQEKVRKLEDQVQQLQAESKVSE